MKNELIFQATLIFLFSLYGGSNLFILAYLRKKDDYVVNLFEFVSLFLGNIHNYKELNKKFVACYRREGKKKILNKLVAISHLMTPFSIFICLFLWVMSEGFY